MGTKMVSYGIRYALLFVAMMVSTVQASEDALWSEPANGLRGRLLVLPPEKPESPFCRIYMEFQNVSDVAGQMKLRFTPDKLTLAVADKDGKGLGIANQPYDGVSPRWQPMLLPYEGTLRFRISFPGLGYQPKTDNVIVDVGPSNAWIIPQDGSTYYLSGILSIEKEKGDHPHMDWSGTLMLPKVAIPNRLNESDTKSSTTAPSQGGDRKPENLTMTLASIADLEKIDDPGYVFVINGVVAYRTLDGLKKYLKELPRNSTLTWSPGCCRMGKEPLLSSTEEMQNFKAFCESCGISFVLVPSG